jgi:hypothetical protein
VFTPLFYKSYVANMSEMQLPITLDEYQIRTK